MDPNELSERASHDDDDVWANAGLPVADRDAWRDVLAYRDGLPEDAARIARHGWTPAQLRAAREDSSLFELTPADRDVATVTARMVLAHETAKYHETRLQSARTARLGFMRYLVDELPREDRWNFPRLAAPLGLTAARVRGILRAP